MRATVRRAGRAVHALFSKDGSTLFVSLWGGARVLLFDADDARGQGRDRRRRASERDGAVRATARLFVACANTNAVWVVDPAAMKATEQISIALFPEAPPGSTPNALALSPDGQRLLVANADNNTVAIVDVSNAGAEPRDRLHSDRLVSDGRRVQPATARRSSC